MSNIAAPLFQKLVAFLTNNFQKSQLQAAVQLAFTGTPVPNLVDNEGAPQIYIVSLLRTLLNYDGSAGVINLLEPLKDQVGGSKKAEIDALIAELGGKPVANTTPVNSSAVVGQPVSGTLKKIKCEGLQKDLELQLAIYRETYDQLRLNLNPSDRVKLELQVKNAEAKIAEIEAEMQKLGCG